MYGFSRDEKHLLFIDCFGLTRLSAPKKVKTDRKITGSDSAGLATVSSDGSVAASYEDIWNKSVVWTFPALKSAKRFDRFRMSGMVIHPEGTHFLVVERGRLEIEPVEASRVLLPLRLDATEDQRRAPAKPVSVDLSAGGPTLPALALGEGRPDVPAPLRVAHDGTLLHFDGGSLVCAELDGSEVTIRWRRALRTPERARVELYADKQRCVLALHHGRRWTVVERREGATAGGEERSFEIESLGAPALAGRYLAYQPSTTLVVRRDLDGDALSEHSLELGPSGAAGQRSTAGVGTIFAGAGGRLMFLCGHRESVLDLVAGVEIPRKLPAKELDIRQALNEVARPYVEAARLAGVNIELARVELNAKYSSVSVTHRIAGGASLFGALLASHSQAVWGHGVALPGSWRMGGYGSHGGVSYAGGATTAELLEGYAALQLAGVGFASTIGFWSDLLDSHRSGEAPKEPASLALLARALLGVIREGPAVKLDYGALAAAGIPSVDEAIEAFAGLPEHHDALPHDTLRFAGRLFNQLHGPDAGRLWMHCLLELEGVNHSSLDYDALRPLLEAHPEAAEPFRAWFRANEIPDDHRRWALEQLRDRL